MGMDGGGISLGDVEKYRDLAKLLLADGKSYDQLEAKGGGKFSKSDLKNFVQNLNGKKRVTRAVEAICLMLKENYRNYARQKALPRPEDIDILSQIAGATSEEAHAELQGLGGGYLGICGRGNLWLYTVLEVTCRDGVWMFVRIAHTGGAIGTRCSHVQYETGLVARSINGIILISDGMHCESSRALAEHQKPKLQNLVIWDVTVDTSSRLNDILLFGDRKALGKGLGASGAERFCLRQMFGDDPGGNKFILPSAYDSDFPIGTATGVQTLMKSQGEDRVGLYGSLEYLQEDNKAFRDKRIFEALKHPRNDATDYWFLEHCYSEKFAAKNGELAAEPLMPMTQLEYLESMAEKLKADFPDVDIDAHIERIKSEGGTIGDLIDDLDLNWPKKI